MNITTRRITPIVLVLLFVIGTPVIMLISQGYRFDTDAKRFTKTGAIYLKTRPVEATIAMNGRVQQVTKNSLVYNGSLIQNLVPGSYRLLITTPYSTFVWQKELTVKPLMVSKATRIAIPQSALIPATTSVATGSISFAIPWGRTDLLFCSDEYTVRKLVTETATSTVMFDLRTVTGITPTDTIQKLEANSDATGFIALTGRDAVIWYQNKTMLASRYLADIVAQTKNKINALSLSWHPTQPHLIIVRTPTAVFQADLDANTHEPIVTMPIRGISTADPFNAFINATGTLMTGDFTRPASFQPIITLASSTDPNEFFDISRLRDNSFVLSGDRGTLFLVKLNEQTPTLVATNVSAWQISNDQSRIAVSSPRGIAVQFLKEVSDDMVYQLGETVRLGATPQESPLTLSFTNNNWSLVSVSRTRVIVYEIDRREPMNAWLLPLPGPLVPVSFDERNSVLRWITDGTLNETKLFAD
jgi:hypothetical protein